MAIAGAEQQLGEMIRELREARRLSVRTLAATAGFSPSFISQVENGQASPSISSLERIASSLGVSLVEFFQAAESRSSAVVRAGERPRLESGWSKAEIESLGGDRRSRLEPVVITLRPGGSSGKRAHPQSREQFLYVIAGEVAVILDREELRLGRGDAVTVSVRRPFRVLNDSARPAQILIVASRLP